jgi:hypothetical protein
MIFLKIRAFKVVNWVNYSISINSEAIIGFTWIHAGQVEEAGLSVFHGFQNAIKFEYARLPFQNDRSNLNALLNSFQSHLTTVHDEEGSVQVRSWQNNGPHGPATGHPTASRVFIFFAREFCDALLTAGMPAIISPGDISSGCANMASPVNIPFSTLPNPNPVSRISETRNAMCLERKLITICHQIMDKAGMGTHQFHGCSRTKSSIKKWSID